MTALVIKCDPPRIDGDEFCVTLPRYKKCPVKIGDEAYVWTSEDAGGIGLAFSGILLSAVPTVGRGSPVALRVRVQRHAGEDAPSKAALRECRDRSGCLYLLARKLYRHAHNKVALIGSEEVNFFQGFFAL